MLSLPNEHLPFEKPEFTGSLYFQADDVDSLWENLRNKAIVVYPLEDFDYGMREFAIRDNNGYILSSDRKSEWAARRADGLGVPLASRIRV